MQCKGITVLGSNEMWREPEDWRKNVNRVAQNDRISAGFKNQDYVFQCTQLHHLTVGFASSRLLMLSYKCSLF